MLDKPDAYRFEDFVAATSRATSGDELFTLFTRAVGHYGYDRVLFSIPLDIELPEELNKHGLLLNYPADWMSYYIEKDFGRIDPVLKSCFTQSQAFTWADMEARTALTDAQTRLMRMAESAGLNNGVGVPVRTHSAMVAGFGLASSERRDAAHADPDILSALATQFYTALKRLYANTQADDAAPVSLTAKEIEILSWVAAGKTDEDIAVILGISRNTVDSHMRNVFRKLEAGNRVSAVVKGISLGHIRP